MYDAIVIGARCAGATTAMLLARAGLDVLLVDRAALPSDIPHGHFVHRQGPARLARWGLLGAADGIPGLGERIRAGRREERWYGATQPPNFLRTPYGPGWALVGDAGAHKDPYMALGICDALRDAELLSGALVAALSGERPAAEALADYEQERDAATLDDYRVNLSRARFEPPPEQQRRLRAALYGDQWATNHFYLAIQGMVDPQTFFNDENLGQIMSGAALRA